MEHGFGASGWSPSYTHETYNSLVSETRKTGPEGNSHASRNEGGVTPRRGAGRLRAPAEERPQGARGRQSGVTRTLVVDDHEIVREGIRAMVESEPGFSVVGEASDGHEAVRKCRELRPDLVLMDVRMPKMDGLEATRLVKAEDPGTIVLMVTTYGDPEYMLRAVKAGAAGYLLKDTARPEFVSALSRVVAGDHPLDCNIAMQILRKIEVEKALSPPEPRLPEPLSRRETEILDRLVLGETNPQIARALHMSQGTVKAKLRRIMQKLEVSDRTQAAVKAIELGLVRR